MTGEDGREKKIGGKLKNRREVAAEGKTPLRRIRRLHRRVGARKLNSNACLNFGDWMQTSRPSEYTRNSIMKAAVALFAERGYDGTSIRAIVSKARVNQAAIDRKSVV